ncbi:anti-sigma factor [Dactylosporangium maewongense]|uniref:Anti-sigma factor n=2 Tax=Dactylosporangium TaxID=35753 RepID=A0ABN2B5J1_9ACTN
MRHPNDGTLRRLLDEPEGVADTDREHVAGCPVCLSGLAAAGEDAAFAGAALHIGTDPDVDAGWRRLTAAGEPRRVPATARGPRWRAVLRSPVVAAVAAVALLTGASAAAAADWLQIFRTDRIAPITVTQADLVTMPDLAAYGDVRVTNGPNVRKVGDAAAAASITGLSVPRTGRLPRGVTGDPTFQVGDQANAVFTFSAEKAAQTAAAAGATLPPPPPGLDGSKFRLSAGPGLALVWQGGGRSAPAMIVARVVAPVAYSSGVPFDTARDYLLSLPGLPESVAAQLRAFSGSGTTWPMIVRSGQQATATDVGGKPATVLTTRDGVMSGVVWVDDGVVTAVAGSLSADEVLSVARGLRWDR